MLRNSDRVYKSKKSSLDLSFESFRFFKIWIYLTESLGSPLKSNFISWFSRGKNTEKDWRGRWLHGEQFWGKIAVLHAELGSRLGKLILFFNKFDEKMSVWSFVQSEYFRNVNSWFKCLWIGWSCCVLISKTKWIYLLLNIGHTFRVKVFIHKPNNDILKDISHRHETKFSRDIRLTVGKVKKIVRMWVKKRVKRECEDTSVKSFYRKPFSFHCAHSNAIRYFCELTNSKKYAGVCVCVERELHKNGKKNTKEKKKMVEVGRKGRGRKRGGAHEK